VTIWFIHHYAVPPTAPGGTRHFAVARWLARQGHRVRIVASSYHYQSQRETRDYQGANDQREMIDGVEFIWVRTHPYRGNSLGRLLNLLSFAWRALRVDLLRDGDRPGAVLGSSPQPFAALAARILARRHRARFVYEVRDIWPQTLVELGRTSRLNPVILVFGWIERHCARMADAIVTLLPGSQPHLVACGARPDRIVWVPNGVDLAQSGPVRPVPRRDTCTFLYAGAMGVANGLGQVIEAAGLLRDRVPGVRVVLMGEGAELERLQSLATRRGATNVVFRPPVAKAAVHDALAEADAFLMILTDSPVFQWGISPNKLFDYLAAGRPVVFAVNTPVDPVAEAGAGVRADPGSPEDLARAMETVAAMTPEARAAMGLRGRQYVEAHHDVDRLAARFGAALVGAAPVHL